MLRPGLLKSKVRLDFRSAHIYACAPDEVSLHAQSRSILSDVIYDECFFATEASLGNDECCMIVIDVNLTACLPYFFEVS